MPDPRLSRREKLDILSAKIQHDIRQRTGIFSTVGMSNANPLLAKLALDNEAKTTSTMRANWSYEDVSTKVWQIPKLTNFWGIGSRMARRLNNLGIHSIKKLANCNPDILQKDLGVIGVQLWFHANGVDESNVREPYTPQSKGLATHKSCLVTTQNKMKSSSCSARWRNRWLSGYAAAISKHVVCPFISVLPKKAILNNGLAVLSKHR